MVMARFDLPWEPEGQAQQSSGTLGALTLVTNTFHSPSLLQRVKEHPRQSENTTGLPDPPEAEGGTQRTRMESDTENDNGYVDHKITGNWLYLRLERTCLRMFQGLHFP